MLKLLIAVPCVEAMHWKFAESLFGLTERLGKRGLDFSVRFEGGTLVYLARDNLARYAVKEGFTHVLWLDDDMVFAPDILEKLLSMDVDVASGVYVSRHKSGRSVLFKSLSPDVRYVELPKDIFPIEGCGFGCVLVKTDVFRFVFDMYGSCFMPNSGYGEDLAFCEKAAKHGYSMMANPHVEVGHIARGSLWPDGHMERY